MKSNDLFQTSSGVGHHWRPGYHFPSSRYQVRRLALLCSYINVHAKLTCCQENNQVRSGVSKIRLNAEPRQTGILAGG